MIEVKHLTKKYGNHIAVNDLSFTANEGQIFGFLGPNGAGKSTTMNMLTGYLAPSDGEILIDGFNILKESELAKKCIGYLPEIPPVYDSMTVEEYLKFTYELKKLNKKERKEHIEEIIEKTKLQDVRTRLIQNLSKGYKQRVGLAQAIIYFVHYRKSGDCSGFIIPCALFILHAWKYWRCDFFDRQYIQKSLCFPGFLQPI